MGGPVGFGELNRRARALVRSLDADVGIPRPLDVPELLAGLARHRGRPIDLFATVNTAGGPCGMWLRQPDRDVIVHAADTSPLHQAHIVLHEIGHMIADHPGTCCLPLDLVRRILPGAGATLVGHLFARSTYATDEEREAELVASLIGSAALGSARGSAASGTGPGRRDRAPSDLWMEETFGA
ncbi:hypothetical protein [Pseudonocardia sp.]|uniref:hypothetical protein n=1 Tax=Pseudonocardia sp. TaxID=60912 RepID=UPI002613C221|nr:hypothetical protein [Pseudonocardia sp.]